MRPKSLVMYTGKKHELTDFYEIARELNVSHQRANQIYKAALGKARRILAKHGYKLEDLVR